MTSKKTVGDTTVPLTVSVSDANGGVTGLTAVVALRRVVDGYYLDFADNTFKATGWAVRQAGALEVSASMAPGVYEFNWNSSLSVTSPVKLVAEYRVTGSKNAIVTEQIDFAYEIENRVWDALRTAHTVPGSFGEDLFGTANPVSVSQAELETALNAAVIGGNSNFLTFGGAMNLVRKNVTNRQELIELSGTNNYILYDDDDFTVLLTQSVTDKNNGVITAQSGSPMNRSKAV